MTCEEFRGQIGEKDLFYMTAGERAALLNHWMSCEPCKEWNTVEADAEGEGMTEEEKEIMGKAVDVIREKDAQDPEFLDTVGAPPMRDDPRRRF